MDHHHEMINHVHMHNQSLNYWRFRLEFLKQENDESHRTDSHLNTTEGASCDKVQDQTGMTPHVQLTTSIADNQYHITHAVSKSERETWRNNTEAARYDTQTLLQGIVRPLRNLQKLLTWEN